MFVHKLLESGRLGDGELADVDAAPWLLLNQRDPRTALRRRRLPRRRQDLAISMPSSATRSPCRAAGS
jgi:hypothetical protein